MTGVVFSGITMDQSMCGLSFLFSHTQHWYEVDVRYSTLPVLGHSVVPGTIYSLSKEASAVEHLGHISHAWNFSLRSMISVLWF